VSASLKNHSKAMVAKHWATAALIDLGFDVTLSNKSNSSLIYASKEGRTIKIRSKACYSDQGVPFRGFDVEDSNFVIFVDLREGILKTNAWIVPTTVVFEGLEREYNQMSDEGRAGARVENRTFYWAEGTGPHYGYERKFSMYRNAWALLDQPFGRMVAARTKGPGNAILS
jgi:hypothetical protein